MSNHYTIHKCFLLISCILAMCTRAPAQNKGKIEMYRYMANDLPGSFQPSIHMQSPKNWYLESRYNYEEVQTFSFYAGKTFSGGKHIEYSVTPMVGYSIGVFTGVSPAVNTDVEWKSFYFSAQSQYSISTKTHDDSFLFSWSELGYSISDLVFAGFTLQYTRTICQTDLEPGIMAGISFKNFEMPLYMFKPFRSERFFVLGLSYEFNLGKK